MKRSPFRFPINAGAALALIVWCAPVAPAQTTGYWQYVRTETYTYTNPNGAYLDNSTGIEGAFTLVQESNDQYHASLGATFWWTRPPAILIPGTAIDWPLAALVTQNVSGRFYQFQFGAGFYQYAPIVDLWSSWYYQTTYPGTILLDYTLPVGATVGSNNALLANPAKVPGSGAGNGSGLTSWLTHAVAYNQYFWSYVYQWIPGSAGACGGTCALATTGQTASIGGGTGSVGVIANSTWNVIAAAPWITVTSAGSGTGNGAVTFTVAANAGAPRNGSILIGGQTYTVHQNGVAFFAGEVALANSVYSLPLANGKPFAYYAHLTNGWIYHFDLGYLSVFAGNGSEVYLWDMSSGHWWYTNNSEFPYMYDFTLNAWVYYFPDTHNAGRYMTNPRYFVNMSTNQIFTM